MDHLRPIDSLHYRVNIKDAVFSSNSDCLFRGGKLSLLGKNLTGDSSTSDVEGIQDSKTVAAGRTIDRTRGGPDSDCAFLQS